MFLHRSNRMEWLLEDLATLLSQPLADPFAAECIVVQSPGMARYLSMGLAKARGIWANSDFVFPKSVVQRACDAVLGISETAELPRTRMTWAVARELRARQQDLRFADFARYLHGDANGDRLLQLATRLAALFDDYLVYRDDMVRAWEQGAEPSDAQAELWRGLVARLGADHVATRIPKLCSALEQGASLGNFPERLAVFGVSALPAPYLRVLSALSQKIPVHMFLLSPCQEYWVELTSNKAAQRKAAKSGYSAQELHLEEGPRLLTALGGVGRDLLRLLDALGEPSHGDFERYQDVEPDCMLQALQSDMLRLVTRPKDAPLLSLSSADRSVEVHVCHSPMREVEVLHDQLLRMFDDEGVQPEDVVVMAPDIEGYAPLVATVFGKDSGRPVIPYRLADRSAASLDPMVDALDAALRLLQGRMPVTEVLDLLNRPAIAPRFSMGESELSLVSRWALESGMRWGVDAAHRGSVGQPALDGNTLLFGLQRLLLGLAMEGQGLSTFAGRLPFDEVQSGEAELLGRFANYLRTLFEIQKSFAATLSPQSFTRVVREVLGRLFADNDEVATSRQRILAALTEFEREATECEFAEVLSWRALQQLFVARLGGEASARGFLSGGVTFCQVVPMRSVPSAVVVLLGMDDGAFPRSERPLSFDKRSEHPRLGDRRLRADDRFLFLEALLSARKKLLLSYVGRGIEDNGVRPPSVLVSELLETLERSYDNVLDVRRHVCVEHRLSATSLDYFDTNSDPRLFTYATHLLEGARARQQSLAPTPFLDIAPNEKSTTDRERIAPVELSLAELERWVADPIGSFLQRRLGLALEEDATLLVEREPMAAEGLERYALGTAILRESARGHDRPTIERALVASGRLPLGVPGQLALSKVYEEVDAIEALAQAATHGDALDLAIDVTMVGVRVTGVLPRVHASLYVHSQFGKLGRDSELRFWVRHLLLNWLATEGGQRTLPRTSVLIGRTEKNTMGELRFGPVDDAAQPLSQLLEFAIQAMQRPRPFVYRVAKELVRDAKKSKKSPRSRAASEFSAALNYSPYLALAYPSFADFVRDDCGRFEHYANIIVRPLLLAIRGQA